MKIFLLVLSFAVFSSVHAQKVDSIYVNLYTDSLKRGTFNYINVDGLLADGRFQPLDSNQIIYKASAGFFQNSSLWLDRDFAGKKVSIRVTLRQNPALYKDFDIYVKQKPDPPLKTAEQLMDELERKNRKKD